MFSTKIIVAVLSALASHIHATTSPTTSPTESLPAGYNLPLPSCSIDVSSGTIVTCAFAAIVSPSYMSVSMQILNYDCITAFDSSLFGGTLVTAETALASGVTSFDSVASLDASSGFSGDVKFCIRTDLKDAAGESFMFRSEETVVTITYDGSFTFVTNFDIKDFEGIGTEATTARKNFGVTATICNSAGDSISSPPPLSLGTNLFVCIETKVAGTKIPSITSFIAEKDAEPPYNLVAASPNVVIRGVGSSKVKVAMNLPARFFADDTVIELSGTVTVERDSRRRLENHRALEEEDASEVSLEDTGFQLVIDVIKNDNDDQSSASGRTLIIYTAILCVANLLLV